jgi:hypothetical protein
LSCFVASERKEKFYQTILESNFEAGHMRISKVGETDITTDDAHIEIKRWKDHDKVIGQRAVKRDRLCAYFFGSRPDAAKVQMIYELLHGAGIEMFSFHADGTIEKHGDANDDRDQEALRNFIQTEMVPEDDPTVILDLDLFQDGAQPEDKTEIEEA